MKQLLKELMELLGCDNPKQLYEKLNLPRQTVYRAVKNEGRRNSMERVMTKGFVESFKRLGKKKRKEVLEQLKGE